MEGGVRRPIGQPHGTGNLRTTTETEDDKGVDERETDAKSAKIGTVDRERHLNQDRRRVN